MRTALTVVSCAALAAAVGFPLTAYATPTAELVSNGGFETPVGSTPTGIPSDGSAPFFVFNSGASGLTGWTITQGSVDLVPNGLWQSATGLPNTFSIDLVGTPPTPSSSVPQTGGISQTITGLVVGDIYQFSYFYSVNPGTDSYNDQLKNKILSVLVTSPANQQTENLKAAGLSESANITSTFSSDIVLYNPANLVLTKGTRTFTNMQWQQVVTTFVAPSDEITISFAAIANDPTHPTNATTNDVLTGPVIDQISLLDLTGGGTPPAPEPASLGMLGAGFVGLVIRRRRKA